MFVLSPAEFAGRSESGIFPNSIIKGDCVAALEALPSLSRSAGRKNPLLPSDRDDAEAELHVNLFVHDGRPATLEFYRAGRRPWNGAETDWRIRTVKTLAM